MVGHKLNFKKFKNIYIIQNIFSYHNGEINKGNKTKKITNLGKLNNAFLNNQWINEEITWEIRKYLEINKNKKHNI